VSLDARQAAALFDPQRLRLARQLNGLQRGELAETVGISPAAVSQFELGRARPRPATLAQIALSMQMPVGFFAGTGTPLPELDTEHTFFRSLRRTTKRDRERALAHATLLAEVAQLIEGRVVLPEAQIPADLTLSVDAPIEEAEHAAARLRELWDLEGPIPNVVRLLERRGVVVGRFPLMVTDVDAFSWPLERPLIVLSADKRNCERSRLDAAHELGHLVMHHSDPEPGSHPMERQAQRFGSAFIAPSDQIRDELPSGKVDWPALVRLKQKWGLSMAALLYRAKELETLSPTGYESAVKYMNRRGWRIREPGEVRQPEQPRLLQKALEMLTSNGVELDDLAATKNLPPAQQLSSLLHLHPAPALRVAV
jgi:Zn-dependent peptidase ImmA (M78 family)/DNA-binding XRE family transcriptional regulator